MNMRNISERPWYRRVIRWGQTNLTEIDPIECDVEWWREYWKKTKTQGVIVNAGGIVAYYPTSVKLHYKAEHLGNRDLYGEFNEAARKDGLAVLARMDCNRATKDFYDAHPDWFSVNPQGEPYKSEGRYFSCINGPYYKEHIPEVLREIATMYHPDGFTDNSWTGISRKLICYCENCKRKFREECGSELPVKQDWDDPVYKKWIKWSYKCRTENWDLFNKVTQEIGGPDCLWLGMVNANPVSTHCSFCDLKEIGERSLIVMCDHQSKDALNGFEQNSLNGGLLHGLSGWDKIIPESMANYVRGMRAFRRASNPVRETRLWMYEGIAGGISPWFHHVGGLQEDRRQYNNAVPVMQWHAENEAYLVNRLPVANVGLVWSQDNIEFYGRNDAEEKAALPWHGFIRALTRARIPFLPVHADHIEREMKNLDVLILPELAVMSDSQCKAVKHFVEAGGSLVFTGVTALLDEWGNERKEFPLEEVTGIKHAKLTEGMAGRQTSDWEFFSLHNYFRLPDERHPIFKGFEETDILPFGGLLQKVISGENLQTAATYIPAFPIYPPEFSWMREPKTDIPAILAGEHASGGRIVYFAGDVDRCYGRIHLPDLGDLLANAVRWAAADTLPLKVSGPGYIDCKLYRQEGRYILHLVNLSGCNQYPGYVEEYLPVGPINISIKADGLKPSGAGLKAAGKHIKPELENGWIRLTLDTLESHEMIVIE